RACVTDSDPPDEVENVDAPRDGNVDAPESDTDEDEVRHREQHQLEESERDCKAEEPRQRRLALQDDRADLVGHRCKGQPRIDDGRRRMHRTFGVWRFDFFVSHFYLAADYGG